MEKYKTKANKAEEQIRELLNDNKNIHRPWGLVSKTLINRTLDCISGEVRIIYENNVNVRPGFEISGDTVFTPNLFVKFSGIDETTEEFRKSIDPKTSDKVFKYENFRGFCDKETSELDLSLFFKDNGILDKKFLLQSDRFHFSYLRREYQILYIDKVEEILKNKGEYFVSKVSTLSDEEVLHILLNIDVNLMTAFNEFDFSQKPPAIIVENTKRTKLTHRQSVSLLLLNLLGFDIVIMSGRGFSDIENEYPPAIYTLFYGEKISSQKKLSKGKKQFIIIAAAIVITATSLAAGILTGNNEKPPLESNIAEEQKNDGTGSLNEEDTSDVSQTNEDDSTDVQKTNEDEHTANIEDSTKVTVTANTDDEFVESHIQIRIKDLNGNYMDMSQISYTVERDGRVDAFERSTQRGHGRNSGPEFDVYKSFMNLTINLQENGGELSYVVYDDKGDYGFLIEGTVDKDTYNDNKEIFIEHSLSDFYKKDLQLTNVPQNRDTLYYYAVSSSSVITPMYSDFGIGCRGDFDDNLSKTIYTNVEYINVYINGVVDNSILITQYNLLPTDEAVSEISLNKENYQITNMEFNPALNEFKYYMSWLHLSGYTIDMRGELPEDMNLTLLTSGDISNLFITLMKSPTDEYYSSVWGVRVKDRAVFGYNAYINKLTVYENRDGNYNLESFLIDDRGNDFTFVGCFDKYDAIIDKYEFMFDVYAEDEVVYSKPMSLYFDDIAFELEDGIYDIKVYPAHENELYAYVSLFKMKVENESPQPYIFEFNGLEEISTATP